MLGGELAHEFHALARWRIEPCIELQLDQDDHHATFILRSAAVAHELVAGHFPASNQVADAGKPKSYLLFIKATRGGWAYNMHSYPHGRIAYPGSSDWKAITA